MAIIKKSVIRTVSGIAKKVVKRGRKPYYTQLLAEGKILPEKQICFYEKGDGLRFGFKRDEYVRRTLNKKGFTVIRVK